MFRTYKQDTSPYSLSQPYDGKSFGLPNVTSCPSTCIIRLPFGTVAEKCWNKLQGLKHYSLTCDLHRSFIKALVYFAVINN